MSDTTNRPGSLRAMLSNAQPIGAGAAALNPQASRIDVDKLEPNPRQYRRRIDQDKIDELASSIASQGQVEAITYRRTSDGKYQIIAGERRWRAVRQLRERATTDEERARFSTILANERVVQSEAEMLDLAIIENLLRADPDEVDTAAAMAEVVEERKLSLQDLARHFSIKADRVKRLLRLHACPAFIKDAVGKGLMIALLDEQGQPQTTDGGRPRQEHRTLDLMAALEFGSLYTALVKAKPASAASRTEKLVRQALEQGWPYRVVQERCRREKERLAEAAHDADPEAGDGGGDGTPPPPAAPRAPPSPFREDDRQVVVYRSRLAAATPEQRAELRGVLEALLRSLPT